jgi:CBS domain containing-hemolysin-like protein
MEHSLTGIVWRLAAILALVLANGFFVAAEFSIVTVRKTRVDQLVAEGRSRARAVRRAVSEPDRYIAATQLGITMASLGLGWIGEPALASLIQPSLEFLPSPVAITTAHSVAVAVAFAVITALHITVGELAPKTIALERSEATALLVVGPTELFMKAFWPFIHAMNGMGRKIAGLFGLRGGDGHALVHSEEELKMLVTASQEAGVLEEHEEQMLHRVFGFSDLTAGQMMVPRTELAAIAADVSGEALLGQLARTGYPTLPVYRNNLDTVVGILHVTDVIKALAAGQGEINAGALAREALTVPETLAADDLLAALQRRGLREAIVIDEYGGTAGLVTFEWLMERIVGDLVAAGHAGRITARPDGSADIDGLALVTDINQQFDLRIDEQVYTTVGGYVLGRIGRRARVGDVIEVGGRTMRVLALDGLRVAKVWLSSLVRREAPENVEERHKGHST